MEPSLPGDIAAGFAEGELPPGRDGHVNGRPVNLPVAAGEPWVGIVANRSSGTGGNNILVRRLVGKLGKLGFGTEVAWTPDELKMLVAEAESRPGCRCLVAVGGDGTVSALVNEQPKVPVTVLPAGTENLAAQHFGLRRNTAALARTIAAGQVLRADLGSAAGRRFLLMTGFGFDGDIVTRHHRARTTRSGRVKPTHRVAYVEPILRSSLFYRFPYINVAIEDPGREETLRGTTVFVFNLPRYALGLPFAPQASPDDGLLDLVVFRDPGPFQALYYLWRVFRGTHLDHPGVYHRRFRRLTLTSNEAIPVQLDGDPAGFLLPSGDGAARDGRAGPGQQQEAARGWTIEVIPGAIDILVPCPRTAASSPVPLVRCPVLR
ncbi:MAG: diacylglycerol kinase family protein [Isosphaeraceae bacterium]|jgi:diacylglycerol kinase family enzyme